MTEVLRAFRALGPVDWASVRRDPMLSWLLVYPVALALVLRWGVPAGGAVFLERMQLDITPWYVLITSLIVVAVPTLSGAVVGFLLLDQQDDRTLLALRVSPLAPSAYVAYRVAVPMAFSIVATPIAIALAGLVPAHPGISLAAAVCAAPLAPITALFLATFAANKVQGFALLKGVGGLMWAPLLAWFVAPPLQWAAGALPQYWPVKLFWVGMADGLGAGLPWMALGLAWQLAVLGLLVRRFTSRAAL